MKQLAPTSLPSESKGLVHYVQLKLANTTVAGLCCAIATAKDEVERVDGVHDYWNS